MTSPEIYLEDLKRWCFDGGLTVGRIVGGETYITLRGTHSDLSAARKCADTWGLVTDVSAGTLIVWGFKSH